MHKLYELSGNAAFWISKPWQWFVVSRGVRAYTFIESGGKVLIVKNWLSRGEWSLPGGGIKAGENPRKGAVREIFEETGIIFQPNELEELTYGELKYVINSKRYVLYSARLKEQPKINKQKYELLDARWVEINQLQEMQVNGEIKAALKALNLV